METEVPPKKRRSWFWIFFSILAFTAFVVIALPNFVRAKTNACQSACVNNLRQIDGAKEQWALENKKPDGYVLTKEDEKAIDLFIPGGQVPKCPSGDPAARYIYNPIGQAPECTFKKMGENHTMK